MNTLIFLAIYIVGECVAYFQIQKWADHEIIDTDEQYTRFMLSLLSWLVYPVYGLVCIYKKCQEE